MNKREIIAKSQEVFIQLTDTCNAINNLRFFEKNGTKWSVAENLQHLVISTKTSSLAFRLPRFVVRWLAGKPNRNSRTFDEVKTKYYGKLEAGGRAGSRFVPGPLRTSKETLLQNWKKGTSSYLLSLGKNRSEKDLDQFLVRHPLLGRITVRELCYFTIFHTEHHLKSIQKNLQTT